jgi:uncharacterized membrane protein
MDTKVIFTKNFNYITYGLMGLGVIGLAYGFLTDTHRTWANLLMNNYYFLSLAIGAAFFFSLQYITQSGWSAMFRRIPEALMAYIPYAAIVMLVMFFGLHDIYHWSHEDAVAHDELLAHKSPYLNIPFFMIRVVIFLGAWVILTRYLRKLSLQEDNLSGTAMFEKMEFWSKIFIFVLALTFSMASFDWIMSIDAHWYSTIFAFKNFAAAFYHGTSLIALIAIILHKKGYFKDMNEYHLLDFSRYMFGLSIIWGYLYFSQFALIWFGNIPEETVYYARRFENGWLIFFIANFAINWFIPFIGLLPQKLDKNINFVYFICILLLVGLYTDIFEQVMPYFSTRPQFGFIEVSVFAGLAGLFLFAFSKALAKAPLIAKNHPYLEESVHHHIH